MVAFQNGTEHFVAQRKNLNYRQRPSYGGWWGWRGWWWGGEWGAGSGVGGCIPGVLVLGG